MKDTNFEVAEKMRDMIRMKSPSERFKMRCEMYEMSRRLVHRAICENKPDISENELRQELFMKFYGKDVSPEQREDIMQHFAKLPNETGSRKKETIS